MEVFYQGTNITDMVQVRKCISRDAAGNRCDSLDIEFENAAGWYSWGPQEDDQIVVSYNGYDTGILFVNTILPVDGFFRIYATALPCAARARGYQSFTGKTIEEIMRACAMSSGMDFQIFGIDGRTIIPYIQREYESCAAFLHRLLKLESAALKCVNGLYTAIGIEYAQSRAAHLTMELTADQPGVEYRREGRTLKALTVETPWATATAEDANVPSGHMSVTRGDVPARDSLQAGRWARGLLLDANRRCERLTLDSTFNPGFTAMTRIDIEGGTDATGEWLVEEVEHDFIELNSTAKLHRCVSSVI